VGRRTSTRVFCAAVLAAVVAAALGGSAAAVSFSITPGGAPVTVTISTAGDKATATFSGTAGQRVSLDITNSTIASMKISLLRPNGAALFTVAATKTARYVDANTLPVNGTYKLVVDPNLDHTGKVTLKLYNIPPDASNTMTVGSPGTTVTTTVPGQNAYFTFSGVAGNRLSLYLNGVTVSSGALTLRNPDNTVLLGPRSFATAPTFIDPITLSQTGTYKLVLDPKGKAKGSMTLTGYDVPADTSAAYTLGTEAIGTTTIPGQRNMFTFSGTQNQRVSVEVISSDFSGTLSLLKPDLSVLASTPVGPAGGFLDTTVLPVAGTGTYTFVVDPSGVSTGALHFTAHDVPADPSVAITAGGPPVTLTTTVAGQNAFATFTGTIGQKVSVLVSNVVNVDPAELDLLNPSGSHAIAAPVTVTSGGAWMQTVTLSQNGVYKILLDPLLANAGSADVQLFNVPADLTGSITPGTPLTVTTTAPGQNATYTFPGTINTRVSLNLTGVTIDNLKVSILKPDGTNLIVKTVGTSGGFAEPVKLTVGGTYKVKVDPQSSFYGSVTVGVYVVPADTTGPLTLGTPLTISTTVPGQNATRTFNGTAGQRISFKFSAVTMAKVKIIVKAPGTNPPTVLQHTVETSDDFVDPITLPAGRTGTYTVTIDPQGASTGSVTLTFYNVPADITGSTSCTTTVPGQNCKLTTTATSGSHTVTVTTNVPADPGQTQSVSLTIYQGTTTTPAFQIGFGTSGPTGNAFDVSFPANGTYTIVVDPFGVATGTTSYTIT
jgi:hypothetical protein